MSNKKYNRRMMLIVLLVLVVMSGFTWYHTKVTHSLEEEIQLVNKDLRETKIKTSAEIKSKDEEIDELDSAHRQAIEELIKKEKETREKDEQIKEKEKESKEKDGLIQRLKKDLQSKRAEEQRVARLESENRKANKKNANVVASKSAGASNTQQEKSSDKSQVLSKEKASKSEQSSGVTANKGSKTRTLGTFSVTYYAIGDGLTPSTVTANGTNVANTIYSPEGYRIVAVDTRVIPMNSILEITINGSTFLAKASDTGSAIKGNIIDLLVSSPSEANSRGRGQAIVKIVK